MIARVLMLSVLMSAAYAIAHPASAQDVEAGEKVFKSQCGACHSSLPGKTGIGPSLHGIVGRSAGMVAGYQYSEANKTCGLTWDAATLDRYLVNPKQAIPGTKMAYAGLKGDPQRTDLIAYLATLQ